MKEERSSIDRAVGGFGLVLIKKIPTSHEGREISRLIEQLCTFLRRKTLDIKRRSAYVDEMRHVDSGI
jgi:hypothetical protein